MQNRHDVKKKDLFFGNALISKCWFSTAEEETEDMTTVKTVLPPHFPVKVWH